MRGKSGEAGPPACGRMENAWRVSHHHTTGAEALRYTAPRAPHQCRAASGFTELRGTWLLLPPLSGKPSRRVGDDLTGQQKDHQHWLVTDLCVGGNMANQSASPLTQRPRSGDELQDEGVQCASRLAGPQTRGSQRGEKHIPSPTGQLGTLWSRVTEPSCNHGGSDGLPANADPKAQAARISGEAARASGCPLHVPSLLLPRDNSLMGALCRWHRHAVPRDLWAVPVALPSESEEFWAAGQSMPKDNSDRSIVLAVHLAVRSV